MPADSLFLEAADRIGARLCRAAIWAGPACNWLGPALIPAAGRLRVIHGAGGPELYAGTSGIALFLGRLYAVTGEPIYRDTALGAIRQALTYRAGIPPAQRWGFYSGWPGIAYAAWQLAEWCAYPDGEEAALRLITTLGDRDVAQAGADVIDGAAGAIPALLWLYSRRPQAPLLELAGRLGTRLLAMACREAMGWSWATSVPPAQHNLTGLAHGVAGIAWALLELWRASGESDFRIAAEHGFAYERYWFDPQTGNWPDFRRRDDPPQAGGAAGWVYGRAWCHGAPGGALARLRAYEITGAAIYQQEARAALATTAGFLTGEEATSAENYSLCHGRAGNADILITAGHLDDPAYHALADRVGRGGIAGVQEAHLPWPCGVQGAGEAPGLMLGLAGIGYFFLRLYDPAAVPSVLLVPVGSARASATA